MSSVFDLPLPTSCTNYTGLSTITRVGRETNAILDKSLALVVYRFFLAIRECLNIVSNHVEIMGDLAKSANGNADAAGESSGKHAGEPNHDKAVRTAAEDDCEATPEASEYAKHE